MAKRAAEILQAQLNLGVPSEDFAIIRQTVDQLQKREAHKQKLAESAENTAQHLQEIGADKIIVLPRPLTQRKEILTGEFHITGDLPNPTEELSFYGSLNRALTAISNDLALYLKEDAYAYTGQEQDYYTSISFVSWERVIKRGQGQPSDPQAALVDYGQRKISGLLFSDPSNERSINYEHHALMLRRYVSRFGRVSLGGYHDQPALYVRLPKHQ